MRRTLLVLVLFGAGVTLLVSGCGSDSSTADDGPEPLTKKQFVQRAEAFCNREYRAEERDMERYAEKHGLRSATEERRPWEEEELNEAVIFPYVREKIAYFKSLPAPEGDEAEVRRMIKAFEDGLGKSEEVPASLVAARPGAKPLPEPFTESYHATGDYGPWLCGQP